MVLQIFVESGVSIRTQLINEEEQQKPAKAKKMAQQISR
jgi:hypothetical protein